MRPEASTACGDYAAVRMECEGQYAAAAVVLELASGVTFRSPEASNGSGQWWIYVFLLHNSLSCSPVVSDSISESAAACHPALMVLWKRQMSGDKEVFKGRGEHEKPSSSWIWDSAVMWLRKGKQLIIWLRNPFEFLCLIWFKSL